MNEGVVKFQGIPSSQKGPSHPLRPGFGTLGNPILVRANFFALKYKAGLIIHDYSIKISPSTEVRDKKKRIIELLEESPEFSQHVPYIAHDNSERLVAAQELPQPLEIEITYQDEGESAPSRNARRYRVEIVKAQTGDLHTDELTRYMSSGF